MRPGSGPTLVLLSLVLAPCVAPASTASAGKGASQAPSFLGFGMGEERRYVLGPPEDLYAGEGAMWTMTLREVLADPPHAIFELTHEWGRGESASEPPVGTLTGVSSSGELRVNRHGFPLELRFSTTRVLYGYGERVYAVRYRLEGDDFRKVFSMGGEDLEHPARVRRTDEVDLEVPTGLWAFAPMALACMFGMPPSSGLALVPVAPLTPGSTAGSTMPRAPLRFTDEVQCREPLFANPGLLSLMLPTLWEAGTGELEFVMLTPAGYFGMPTFAGGGSTAGAGGVTSGGVYNRLFDSATATDARTNSDIDDLRYVDRVQVGVGPRTLDAWRFEGMNAFEAVYVDDDGVVVRVDLAGTASVAVGSRDEYATLAEPSRMDNRGLWIRLLFPSEY